MERFAVQNVGSLEFLTDWLETEQQAQAAAAEAEEHDTQLECRIVRFSEWAPRQRLSSIRGQTWDGQYPLVTFGPDWSLVFTGEIVSAQEAGITVTECGYGAYRRGG